MHRLNIGQLLLIVQEFLVDLQTNESDIEKKRKPTGLSPIGAVQAKPNPSTEYQSPAPHVLASFPLINGILMFPL